MSRIQRRIDEEYRSSLTIPAAGPSGQPTMLLLGNSLLLEGVDFPSLRGTMIPRYDVHRLVIEQTDYLDLYYILRTLFRNGSRPHDLVLCLSVGQLMADDTRGEFTARYVDAASVADLAHREHFDATTMTNYMFAHWSGWFGTRAEIRKWLLGRMMPDIGDLTTVLGFRPAPHLSESEVQRGIGPRLRELKSLCDQYGSRLTVLIPPSLGDDHAEAVRSLGSELGIRVLVPVEPGGMNRSQFRDGFHLTPAGAQLFTAQLSSQL
ncbi:MAG: hypothetical protein WBM04_14640 [Candidatus Korobacteraceae bacterium]